MCFVFVALRVIIKMCVCVWQTKCYHYQNTSFKTKKSIAVGKGAECSGCFSGPSAFSTCTSTTSTFSASTTNNNPTYTTPSPSTLTSTTTSNSNTPIYIQPKKTGGLGWWFGVGGKAFFFAVKLLQF